MLNALQRSLVICSLVGFMRRTWSRMHAADARADGGDEVDDLRDRSREHRL